MFKARGVVEEFEAKLSSAESGGRAGKVSGEVRAGLITKPPKRDRHSGSG